MSKEQAPKVKVTIANFVLADHDITTTYNSLDGAQVKTTAVNNFRISQQRSDQVAEYFRGASVQVFDRGNKRTSVTFEVARLHPTLRASEVYVLEHATKIPNRGLVILESKTPNGPVTRRYLNNAECEVVDASYEGVSTFHSYQILGGEILTKAPAA